MQDRVDNTLPRWFVHAEQRVYVRYVMRDCYFPMPYDLHCTREQVARVVMDQMLAYAAEPIISISRATLDQAKTTDDKRGVVCTQIFSGSIDVCKSRFEAPVVSIGDPSSQYARGVEAICSGLPTEVGADHSILFRASRQAGNGAWITVTLLQ